MSNEEIFAHLRPDTTEYPSFEELKARRDMGEPLQEIVPGLDTFPHDSFMSAHQAIVARSDLHDKDLRSDGFLLDLDAIKVKVTRAQVRKDKSLYVQALEELIAVAVWHHYSASNK